MNVESAVSQRFLNLNFTRISVRRVLKKSALLIKWPRRYAKIMYIGCGDGQIMYTNLLPLIRCNIEKYHLTAVDKSALRISKLNEENTIQEIDFEILNIATKTLDDKHKEKYDILFSFMCFGLVVDYNQWIKNVYSMLKPGGRTFFVMLTQNPITKVIQKKSMKGKWAKYLKEAAHLAGSPFCLLQNPDKWIAMVMRDYGFKSVCCKSMRESYAFEDTDQLQEFISSMEKIHKDVPNAMLQEYLDEFTASVARKCYQVPGRSKLYMAYTTLLVIATK